PTAWAGSGAVQGLRARGGLVVDVAWEEGAVTDWSLAAVSSGAGHDAVVVIGAAETVGEVPAAGGPARAARAAPERRAGGVPAGDAPGRLPDLRGLRDARRDAPRARSPARQDAPRSRRAPIRPGPGRAAR